MFYFTKQAIIGAVGILIMLAVSKIDYHIYAAFHTEIFPGGNGSDGTGKDSFGNGTQQCKEMDPVAWKYVLSAGRGDEDRSDPFSFHINCVEYGKKLTASGAGLRSGLMGLWLQAVSLCLRII